MKFTLVLPQAEIIPAYQKALQAAAQKVTIKGFRQGKAPLNVVEDNLDKAKLYEQVINQLLPSAYSAYVKEHKLQPIVQPKFSLKNLAPNTDWEIEAEIAEKPAVTLNDYSKKVAAANKKFRQAHKDLKDDKGKDTHEGELVNAILQTLLDTCTVEIPQLLVDESVDYSLSKLVDQVTKLGLTLDKYLASLKKTPEQLRSEYAETATRDLKLEFILEAIADAQKLHPTQADIDKVVDGIKDPETKKFAKNDLDTLISIRTALMRSHVVDHLKTL